MKELDWLRRQRGVAGTIAGRITMVGNGMLVARAGWALLVNFAEVAGALFISRVGG